MSFNLKLLILYVLGAQLYSINCILLVMWTDPGIDVCLIAFKSAEVML